jgi:hypothetical protein
MAAEPSKDILIEISSIDAKAIFNLVHIQQKPWRPVSLLVKKLTEQEEQRVKIIPKLTTSSYIHCKQVSK